MSNLVIVAIPDENDRVWKISSEKVPHLTVLFLGDNAGDVANVAKITDFVEHAVNTTLKRFYLPVDRRGVLGPDEADVLFFKKGRYDYKAIRDFRAALLQDNNIKTAYDSAQQFDGPWQPHLTLGYPATPANEDPEDRPLYDVSFNRIAVWTGDYEGTEFLLKDYWDEIDEAFDTVPMDVAMSDIRHHGVKGMRWGVRKSEQITVGGKTKMVTPKKAAKAEEKWAKDNASINTWLKVHNAGAEHFNAHIDALNNKPEYKDLNLLKDPNSSISKKYMEDVHSLSKEALEKGVSKLNASPTGKYKVVVVHGSEYGEWGLAKDHVTHAAIGDEITWVNPKRDAQGRVISVEFVLAPTPSMAQTADLGAEFLSHYGVKGMRWGMHRQTERSTPTPKAPSATSVVPRGDKRKTKIEATGGENHPAHEDAIKVAEAKAKLQKSGPAALSNQELRDVAARIQLEQQVKQLTTGKGKKFVTSQLKNQGQQELNAQFNVNRQNRLRKTTA